MACLKCGQETDQTFCEECRAVMEKYPVKPGTIVMIPKKRNKTVKYSAPRRQVTIPEAQFLFQKKTIRRLTIAVCALSVMVLSLGFGVYRLLTAGPVRPLGQNFSTVSKPTEETTETTAETN